MEFNIGDRVKIKSEEYLRTHKFVDRCTCVSKMYQFADLECTVDGVYSDKKVPRYRLRSKEYPTIDVWSWVPHWLEPVKTIDIQADALQDLLQI